MGNITTKSQPSVWIKDTSPSLKIASTGPSAQIKGQDYSKYYSGWNPTDAAADFKSTYGGDINKLAQSRGGGGDTGNASTSGVNDFVSLMAQLTGSPMELPALNVKDWSEYEKQAMEELRPYYERLLKEEGGDVEKAKMRLEEDYKAGIRINREDYQTAKANLGEQIRPGESIQDYYNRAKAMPGANPQEGIGLLDELAKRGMLQSGFAKTDTSNLATAQQRRQEAIQTAKNRYEEQAGITKGRAMEDLTTQWQRRQFELGQQQNVDAGTLARQKRADDIATQEIERSNILRKAINNLYG